MEATQKIVTWVRPARRDLWRNILACMAIGAAASIFFQKSYGSCGDYPQHFRACWWGLGIGASGAVVFSAIQLRWPVGFRLHQVLAALLRLFLAWVMLGYAIIKIIPTQFPHLLANLDSTFAELNPMRVAWTFFGYSEGYQMLMGWAEGIPALLLLSRRTALLGAFIMVPVLVQVVAINIFFEVCVILNSSIYLGVATVLVLLHFHRLWTFFLTDKPVPAPERPSFPVGRVARRSVLIVYLFAVAAVLFDTSRRVVQTWNNRQQQIAQTPLDGKWGVGAMEYLKDGTWVPVSPSDTLYLDRLYFQGISGVFKGPARRERAILQVDSAAHIIKVMLSTPNNERPHTHTWQYLYLDPMNMQLTGRLWQDSVRILVRADGSAENSAFQGRFELPNLDKPK